MNQGDKEPGVAGVHVLHRTYLNGRHHIGAVDLWRHLNGARWSSGQSRVNRVPYGARRPRIRRLNTVHFQGRRATDIVVVCASRVLADIVPIKWVRVRWPPGMIPDAQSQIRPVFEKNRFLYQVGGRAGRSTRIREALQEDRFVDGMGCESHQ